MSEQVPNPGSDEAIKRGCTCPVLDNEHGKGFYYGVDEPCFCITEGCPLHTSGATSGVKVSTEHESGK